MFDDELQQQEALLETMLLYRRIRRTTRDI